MGKKTGGNKRAASGAKNDGAAETWTRTDHAVRTAKKLRKSDSEKIEERARRSALLTRDSKEKREEGKVRLHIKRVERQLEKLRQRFQRWDDQEEQRLQKEQLEKEQRERDEDAAPKKRKGRKGPETWKLKGAARPAWQVYDFDTRYVDPHVTAHEAAKEKARRLRNVFSICKGRFGDDADDVPQPYCREFLALLMQLGNLSRQANKLKSARAAFIECMELESTNPHTTPARCQLMKLYLEANRPESARRLWEKLSPDDSSVWIRYSAALIEYVSWKLLAEPGSTEETARTLLAKAIHSNIFCAYYLAFWSSFEGIMEHVDEIEDANEDFPLEEAIEYCNSEQGYGAWQGTDGAVDWIKDAIISTLNGGSAHGLTRKDLAWKDKLAAVKANYEADTENDDSENEDDSEKPISESEGEENDSGNDEDEESEVDGAMFAGMFKLAMEMLEDSGKIKAP
jgi:tetratricopeptide (TPR) repeat protein